MKTTVNKRIELLRNHLNLTQQGFSNLIGISSGQLSRIENEKSEPEKATLNKIFSTISVSPDWLLHGKGDLNAKVKASGEHVAENPYKDALVSELKQQVEFLKELVRSLSSGKATAGFNAVLKTLTGSFDSEALELTQTGTNG